MTYGLFLATRGRCTTETVVPRGWSHAGEVIEMRVLIVYGSKRGGTAGLAHMIANAFERQGWQVDVRDAADRPGIGDVDVVVVGGGLTVGRWNRDAKRWVRQHAPTLRRVPVWLFSSGPLDDSARAGDIAPTPDLNRLASEIEATGHMTFGGYLDPHPRGFVARQMARHYAGDWRDPQHVLEWVHHIVVHTTVSAAIPPQRVEEPVRDVAASTPATPAAPPAGSGQERQ